MKKFQLEVKRPNKRWIKATVSLHKKSKMGTPYPTDTFTKGKAEKYKKKIENKNPNLKVKIIKV